MTSEAPTSEAEVAAVVRAAGEGGFSLITEGGGTKRCFGPASPAEARRVSLRGLARVTHEPADMILSVEAGARLRDVQALLAAHDQWLPLDPPFADATIGGILATHSSGPRRLGYGTSKDLLLGLRVVGAHGHATKSGGRVVKNVSGYDLHRPQVGAFGSLGVITLAHFKVAARPEVSALWALPCATLDAAQRLLLELAATPLRPVALEALDAAEARRLRAAFAALPGPDAHALALVGVEGSRASFERHARELASHVSRGVGDSVVVERPAADALWAALADLPAAHAADVRVRLGARPHDLPPLLAALELERAPVRGVQVRAATGLAWVSLAAAADASPLAPLVERWSRFAAARGGYAVVESAPVDLLGRAHLPFGAPPTTGPAGAMRRAWDPRETLNPGRMAG
jgi:glycolate dehydrogenase FAD-binding subunit